MHALRLALLVLALAIGACGGEDLDTCRDCEGPTPTPTVTPTVSPSPATPSPIATP